MKRLMNGGKKMRVWKSRVTLIDIYILLYNSPINIHSSQFFQDGICFDNAYYSLHIEILFDNNHI